MIGNELLGIIMLAFMLGVIFVGFPISFTLIFVALIFGYYSFGNMVFHLMVSQSFGFMQEEVLAAVPLFIFMGYMTEQAGLMERLFEAFRNILAPLKGSLYLGVVLTATVFAMATGIVGAAVTVLGIMSAPIMIRCGYSPRLAAGAIAAGGTLGILIPPSVMLIVMGPVLGVSVAKLYAAAFGPGFLLASLYIIYLIIRCQINPKLGPPVPKEERITDVKILLKEVFFGMVPLGLLITATLGSILAGLATPTEAASMGAVGSDSPGPWLSEAHLGEISNRRHRNSSDKQHGDFPGGRLERLRRGLCAPRVRRPDDEDLAFHADFSLFDASRSHGPDFPSRLAL